MKIDLHCHTKISDGSLGIAEVVMVASRLKMKYLSITDHDTMSAVSRAVVIGKRLNVEVIPGVELSAYDYERNKKVHILCYLPEYPDRMEGYFKRIGDQRRDIANKQLRMICEKFPITPQMVAVHTTGCSSIFKCHILHSLLDCGYTDRIYGDLYKALFGPGKMCDLSPEYDGYQNVISLIKSAGGVAVLAHPGEYDNFDAIGDLIECGIDGIEVHTPKNTPEQREKLLQVCMENKLIVTGGTDFHGMYATPIRPFGSEGVTEAEVKALFERKSTIKAKID